MSKIESDNISWKAKLHRFYVRKMQYHVNLRKSSTIFYYRRRIYTL